MKVKFIYGGEEREIDADEGRTLLDMALIAQIPAPYSCMEGHCHTCEARIESGRTSEGTEIVRTCQALPWSEYVVVNYDKGLCK